MARPIKNNADYFSHDASMRNDPKIKYLRSKYGLSGYAIFCMMLEYLADSEFFETEITETQKLLMAGDFGVDIDFLEKFLEDAVKIGLFLKEGNKIFSSGLKKRLEEVVKHRERSRRMRKEFVRAEKEFVRAETQLSEAEMQQSKGKEIKENIKEKSFCFDFFIKKFPKQTRILEAEKVFAELTEVEKAEIEKVYGFWLAYWSSIDVKFVPNPFTWLKSKGWKQKIPEKFGNVATTQSITPKARSDPPKSQEEKILKNEKDERERILQFFREKLDEETRAKIEKQADEKFFESPVKKWDLLYSIEIARITKQFIF